MILSLTKNKLSLLILSAVFALLTIVSMTTRANAEGVFPGWSVAQQSSGGLVLVCKQYTNSAYGPLWRVKVAYLSNSNTVLAGNLRIYRPNSYGVHSQVQRVDFNVRNGGWGVKETYASIYAGDKFYTEIGQAGTSIKSLDPVENCN